MRTRFAPAPTGYLHLGHVANALCVWGAARAAGGEVLLRIEDHDRERSRPEYERALLDDLDWLGFVPDLYPTDAFRAGRCESRQSDRHEIYTAVVAGLRGRGLLYACRCSRSEILDAVSSLPDAAGRASELRYPGICRERALAFDGDVGWRVRLPDTTISFVDRWCGPQTQTPAAQCGDLLIRDRRGNWTYQFVATVDDFLQGITDVIRGRDLLESTGRQILLAALIGREHPAAFGHHRLIMKSPTQKLSKSDGDSGVRDLRQQGWRADDVLTEANARLRMVAGGRSGASDVVPPRQPS
jgi:glutamyl/glutaminyl-tRNA synthetase